LFDKKSQLPFFLFCDGNKLPYALVPNLGLISNIYFDSYCNLGSRKCVSVSQNKVYHLV